MNNIFRSTWFWVLVVVVVLGFYTVGSYNRFVTLAGTADGQWAQVQTVLQRRFDLIPNLEASVKGIFKQEEKVFTALADARTKYGSAQASGTIEEKVAAARELQGALGRLLVVVENYPELRSSANVSKLMDELAGTENRISTERGRFNEATRDYNIAVARFPGKIVASIFGFDPKQLFEAESGAEKSPTVNLE